MANKNYYMAAEKIPPKRWLGYTELVHGRFGIHIAKTSAGWKPIFQQYPFIHSLSEWKTEYEDYDCTIFDEYGQNYSWNDFMEIINTEQEKGKSHAKEQMEHVDKNSILSYDLYYDLDDDGYEFMTCSFC